MSTAEERLAALGYILPEPLKLPPGATLPFPWVRVVGSRAIVSGHGPTNPDGSLATPLVKVSAEVSEEQAYVAARLTGLAILGSLKRELGSLERIACWSRVFGMVNSAPSFKRQPAVINGFTDLIVNVFGAERGAHARSAVGVTELPFGIPVEIEGEVELGVRLTRWFAGACAREEASLFYESRMPGLGKSFAAEVESTIALIREFPETGSPIGISHRRAA